MNIDDSCTSIKHLLPHIFVPIAKGLTSNQKVEERLDIGWREELRQVTESESDCGSHAPRVLAVQRRLDKHAKFVVLWPELLAPFPVQARQILDDNWHRLRVQPCSLGDRSSTAEANVRIAMFQEWYEHARVRRRYVQSVLVPCFLG